MGDERGDRRKHSGGDSESRKLSKRHQPQESGGQGQHDKTNKLDGKPVQRDSKDK